MKKIDPLRAQEAKETACRSRHGFWVGAGPFGRWFVYVEAGHDAEGAPLTWACEAPAEILQRWRSCDYLAIGRWLQLQGKPVRNLEPKPSLLKRLWRGIFGKN